MDSRRAHAQQLRALQRRVRDAELEDGLRIVFATLELEAKPCVEQNKRLTAELAQTKDELHTALVKVTPELLANHARHGVAYAEQMGGTPEQKWRHAVDASIISDKGANGVQDWTDAQHRIAVEVAVLELNTKAGK